MYACSTEAMFSRSFTQYMRKRGWFVQRIESGTTGRGIPDIYTITPAGQAIWIELKLVRHDARNVEEIPWRPGQQAWLRTVGKSGQKVCTICRFRNEIWLIPHNVVYKLNIVKRSQVEVHYSYDTLLG